MAAVVLACNEEGNIGACLESLRGWVREIFVVDSGSTDRTVEIAERLGARVFRHPFETYARQRNWAIENLPISAEWELHLDADERLTPQLRTEIERVMPSLPGEVAGLLISRLTVFMGRAIRHGGHYPAWHARFFRRGRGHCEDRLYDQHFMVAGEVRRLRAPMIDTITTSIDAWVQRHNRWSMLEAQESMRGERGDGVGPKLLGNPIERRRWLRSRIYDRAPLFIRPALYFAYRYFLRLGFLDGPEGMIFHLLQGFVYRVLVDAKIYEARRRGGLRGAPNP